MGETIVLLFFIVFLLLLAGLTIRIIQQSKVALVERLGRFHAKLERGINFVIPFVDRIVDTIDLRERVMDFPPQPVITKDNVTMQIDTVVFFQVTDPVRYTYEIANPIAAIENLTATTLRNIIGDLDLDQTLTSRDVVNSKLRSILDEATDKWGIRVSRVELKNIMPPRDIQDAMEKQMRAERERRQVILLAEGEKNSAILRAEGEKQSAILRAEAEKEATIRRAEGTRQSQILEAQGEAEAILQVQEAKAAGLKKVFEAIKDSNPTKEVVAVRALEAMEAVANGPANKIVIPSEALSLLGAIAGAKEMFNSNKT